MIKLPYLNIWNSVLISITLLVLVAQPPSKASDYTITDLSNRLLYANACLLASPSSNRETGIIVSSTRNKEDKKIDGAILVDTINNKTSNTTIRIKSTIKDFWKPSGANEYRIECICGFSEQVPQPLPTIPRSNIKITRSANIASNYIENTLQQFKTTGSISNLERKRLIATIRHLIFIEGREDYAYEQCSIWADLEKDSCKDESETTLIPYLLLCQIEARKSARNHLGFSIERGLFNDPYIIKVANEEKKYTFKSQGNKLQEELTSICNKNTRLSSDIIEEELALILQLGNLQNLSKEPALEKKTYEVGLARAAHSRLQMDSLTAIILEHLARVELEPRILNSESLKIQVTRRAINHLELANSILNSLPKSQDVDLAKMNVLGELSSAYHRIKDYPNSIIYCKKQVELYSSIYGSCSPLTMHYKSNLFMLYMAAEDFSHAVTTLNDMALCYSKGCSNQQGTRNVAHQIIQLFDKFDQLKHADQEKLIQIAKLHEAYLTKWNNGNAKIIQILIKNHSTNG